MELISSNSNPKVKQARALHQRKARRSGELFIVEGIRHVGEAVEAGAEIQSILYAPDHLRSGYAQELIQKLSNNGIPCLAISASVFATIADKDNPQGLLAIVRQPDHHLSDLTPVNFAWGVALVDPQDPGNLGTIMRTIDAVSADGLLLLASGDSVSGLVDPYHPTAIRASMGSLFWRPVVEATFSDFIDWASRSGYHIYGTSAHASIDVWDIESYQTPCILLMGSERAGLTSEQSAACEQLIRLPMHGRATSLNLAVANGVILYDMLQKAERLAQTKK